MRHKLTTISSFIIMTLLSVNVFAEQEPEVGDYAFEKNILIKTYDKEVKAPLDKDILKNVKENFSNFAIFNSKNEDIPFELYIEDFQKLKEIDVVGVSSMREIEGREVLQSDISDDNHFTVFNFSERIDRKDASWVIFDLKKSVSLGRVEVFLPEKSKVFSIEIKAGNSQDNLKTIVAKKGIKPIYNKITLSTLNFRFVKISFWGTNVRVEDVEFTTAKNGYIYFNPQSGEKYLAKYGNTNIDFFRFTKRLEAEKDISEMVYFSNQKWNKKIKEDLDDDGVENEEDNCPFVKNRFQKDSDEDGIGNDCDNAPNAKNYDQADIDGDGIGDIIDNCELKKNPDQKNKDGDEYGDVCDGADASSFNPNDVIDTDIFNRKNILIGGLLILALIILGFFWKKRN